MLIGGIILLGVVLWQFDYSGIGNVSSMLLGSTNTILHLLAAAQEGGVNFTMADIDRLSHKVPHLSKVAPSTNKYHMEDVHRAGGVMALLGELDRAGLINRRVPTVHSTTMEAALQKWDVRRSQDPDVKQFYRAGPGNVPTQTAFSQDKRWPELDLDRENGCIRDMEHAYSRDGGLAVLYGNIAVDGCVVKTAGVDESILKFSGPARIFESQRGIENLVKLRPGKATTEPHLMRSPNLGRIAVPLK